MKKFGIIGKFLKSELFHQILFWAVLLLLELVHLKDLYSGASILAGGDSYNHLQLARVGMYPYVWDISVPFGGSTFTIPNLLGFQLYTQVLGFLGTATLQRVMLFSLYFLKFVAFVKLTQLFYRKFSVFALLPSVILVVFNPFGSLNPFAIFPLMYGIYLPFSLYYFVKVVDSRAVDLFTVFKLVLVSIIFSPINANIALASTVFVPQALYLLCNLKNIKRNTFINLITYFSLLLISNLWWAMSLFRYFMTTGSDLLRSNTWFKATGAGTLFQNFRLIGQWGWYSGHFLHPYYPFSKYYDSPVILIVTYSIVLLATTSTFLMNTVKLIKAHKIFMICFFVLSIFLVSGARPPLGGIYQFLFDNLPGFRIFREPFTKFGEMYVLSLSVLFYIFLVRIETYLSSKYKALVFLIIMLFVVAMGWPTLTGEHVPSFWNGSSRTIRVEIPQYWIDLEKYANDNLKGARVLATPNVNYGGGWNWAKGFSSADDIAINFLHFGNNILRQPFPSGVRSDTLLKEFYLDFKSGKPVNNYYGLMGAEYVLQENDLDWRYASADITPTEANARLSQSLIKEIEFGKFSPTYLGMLANEEPNTKKHDSLYSELLDKPALVLYRVPGKLKTSRIYTPTNVHLLDQKLSKSGYSKILASDNFKTGDVLMELQTNILNSKYIDDTGSMARFIPPKRIDIVQINPTKYIVEVSGISNGFFLQFTEQFDPGWKVSIVSGLQNQQHSVPLAEKNHFITNGFSNGWLIESPDPNVTLSVEFTPQKNLQRSLVLLALVVLICLVGIIIGEIRKLQERYKT